MMELYPVYEQGRYAFSVRTFSDYVEILKDRISRLYLWDSSLGYRAKTTGNFYQSIYEEPLSSDPVFRGDLVEGRLAQARETLRGTLQGKTVMADLSGGKDSTAQLFLLSRLQEYIDFRLIAVYVHMPYLEPVENIEYAERIAEKLGVDFYYIEADRRMVVFHLLRDGLPRRGVRWCTYLKAKALRESLKRLRADFEAKGDRMLESGKRMSKLRTLARSNSFVQGRTLNLIYDLSAVETAKIVKDNGLVHPHYLQGIPRVSCRYCPYRGLYELKASMNQSVEDEGLIEESAHMLYDKYYSKVIPWDVFWSLALWRFQPSLSRMRLKEARNVDYTDSISSFQVRAMFRSMWESI